MAPWVGTLTLVVFIGIVVIGFIEVVREEMER